MVEITGMEQVEKMMREMMPGKADAAMRKALRAGGEVIRAAVEERAPERPDLPSGTALPVGALASDITMTIKTDGKGDGFAFIKPGKYTLHVARWVEYGHRQIRGGYSRVIKKGPNAGKSRGPGIEIGNVPAHPFIRPAFEESHEEAQRVGQTVLVQEVMKVARQNLAKTA